MNNELEQQLAKVVEKALNVAEQTGDFVLEQAPQLLQEFYMWHTTKYILGILLGVILLVLARYMNSFWAEKYDGKKVEWDKVVLFGRIGDSVGMILPSVIVLICGLVFFSVNTYKLIFITVAPKLYLIEYFIH